MATFDELWHGAKPEVVARFNPGQYSVKFYAEPYPGRPDFPGIDPQAVQGVAVFLEAQPGGSFQILGFVGTGHPYPGISLYDFIERAVTEVRAAVNPKSPTQ